MAEKAGIAYLTSIWISPVYFHIQLAGPPFFAEPIALKVFTFSKEEASIAQLIGPQACSLGPLPGICRTRRSAMIPNGVITPPVCRGLWFCSKVKALKTTAAPKGIIFKQDRTRGALA